MLMDLHVHQNRHSKDSQLDIYKAIEEAKSLGLSGICITDHDDLGLKEDALNLSKETGFLIVVGVEINTLHGDLLCFGINELPEKKLSAQDTINYVHENGGVCIAAHPFRNNNRGLKDFMFLVKGLDAVEVYNGRTDDNANKKAFSAAFDLKLPMTGGSDAHKEGEVGAFVTRFLDPILSEQDFIKSIRLGRIRPESLNEFKTKSA